MEKRTSKQTGLLRTFINLLLLGITVIIVVIVLRTATLKPRSIKGPPCKPEDSDFIRADKNVITNFRTALSFQTISKAPHDYNIEELLKYQQFLIQGKK